MILHLRASTSAAGYAIFDPAAIPAFIGSDLEEAFETILIQNELGNLMLYSDTSDGQMLLRIYVDEDPIDELTCRVSNLARRGFYRFPGGRLCFTGVEDIHGVHAHDGIGEIPAGTYSAEGFDVDWPHAHVRDALRNRVGTWAYTFRGMLYVSTAGGCLGAIISSMFFVVAALVGYSEIATLVLTAFMA